MGIKFSDMFPYDLQGLRSKPRTLRPSGLRHNRLHFERPEFIDDPTRISLDNSVQEGLSDPWRRNDYDSPFPHPKRDRLRAPVRSMRVWNSVRLACAHVDDDGFVHVFLRGVSQYRITECSFLDMSHLTPGEPSRTLW